MTPLTQRQQLADLQQVTREYASFSRSCGGLGNVLGGLVGLLVYGAVWLLGAGIGSAVLSIGLTLLWLAGKEAIRRRLYRPFGRAQELWTGEARRQHRAMALILTVPLVVALVGLAATGWLSRPVGWPYFLTGLIALWLVWRSLYTIHELLLGTGLLFICAVTASGHRPDLLALAYVPVYALAMIPLGMSEHRQFQAMATRLQGHSEDPA